ncbi:MAG TPA: hypothetical protein VEX69_05930 [Candidatus Limnocylindria bacterium]|nr:hypothetical protein [Candidatus Limnocylindria bacterium]
MKTDNPRSFDVRPKRNDFEGSFDGSDMTRTDFFSGIAKTNPKKAFVYLLGDRNPSSGEVED